MTTAKKPSACTHCGEALKCPTCDAELLPAIYGELTLGFLCPKCMRKYSEQTEQSELEGKLPLGADRYPHMDN